MATGNSDMREYLSAIYRTVSTWMNGWGRQEWIIALVVVVAFGAFCMRGFNMRTKF